MTVLNQLNEPADLILMTGCYTAAPVSGFHRSLPQARVDETGIFSGGGVLRPPEEERRSRVRQHGKPVDDISAKLVFAERSWWWRRIKAMTVCAVFRQ